MNPENGGEIMIFLGVHRKIYEGKA